MFLHQFENRPIEKHETREIFDPIGTYFGIELDNDLSDLDQRVASTINKVNVYLAARTKQIIDSIIVENFIYEISGFEFVVNKRKYDFIVRKINEFIPGNDLTPNDMFYFIYNRYKDIVPLNLGNRTIDDLTVIIK